MWVNNPYMRSNHVPMFAVCVGGGPQSPRSQMLSCQKNASRTFKSKVALVYGHQSVHTLTKNSSLFSNQCTFSYLCTPMQLSYSPGLSMPSFKFDELSNRIILIFPRNKVKNSGWLIFTCEVKDCLAKLRAKYISDDASRSRQCEGISHNQHEPIA